MRTTIRLNDALLREAKLVAATSGSTLTAVIEGALREALSRRRQGPEGKVPVTLPTSPGWGLRPSLDLNNSAALLDLMDRDDTAGR